MREPCLAGMALPTTETMAVVVWHANVQIVDVTKLMSLAMTWRIARVLPDFNMHAQIGQHLKTW